MDLFSSRRYETVVSSVASCESSLLRDFEALVLSFFFLLLLLVLHPRLLSWKLRCLHVGSWHCLTLCDWRFFSLIFFFEIVAHTVSAITEIDKWVEWADS